MQTPDTIAIINPKAGTRGKRNLHAMLGEALLKAGVPHEIHETKAPGHAEEIARAYAGKVGKVIAAGGDGTVNEVGRALAGSGTALAIIPCGSGNGLARDLQIPLDKKLAIKTALHGNAKLIDHGLMNGHTFFCTCGTGFDASVSISFAHAGKRGILSYIEKTLEQLLDYEPKTYNITVDGGETFQTKAFLVACANAAQYGNNAFIAPQASVDDGLINVTIVEPFTPFDIPGLVIQLFTKTIDKNSNIKTFGCKTLKIETVSGNPAHYDGEPVILGNTIDISVVRKALKVIVPSSEHADKRLDRALAQRYKMIMEGIMRSTDYIENINDNINRRIIERNKEVLDFIRQKNEEMLASIQRLLNKK